MEITLTEKINLEVVEYPFPINFTFSNQGYKEYYFTPTGKCKVKISQIRIDHLGGKMSEEQYKALMAEMKAKKSDIITDGWNYYTTGDRNLIQLLDIVHVMDEAQKEWNVKFAYSGNMM